MRCTKYSVRSAVVAHLAGTYHHYCFIIIIINDSFSWKRKSRALSALKPLIITWEGNSECRGVYTLDFAGGCRSGLCRGHRVGVTFGLCPLLWTNPHQEVSGLGNFRFSTSVISPLPSFWEGGAESALLQDESPHIRQRVFWNAWATFCPRGWLIREFLVTRDWIREKEEKLILPAN